MSKVVLYDTAHGFPKAPGALEAVSVLESGVKYDFGFIDEKRPKYIATKKLKKFMEKLSTKAIIYVPQTPKQKKNNKLELETAYAWLDLGLVPLYAQRSDNKENKFLQFSTEESDLYGKLFGNSRDSEALQTAIARYTSYKEKNKPKAGLLFQDLKLQRENAQYREEELRKNRLLLAEKKEELRKDRELLVKREEELKTKDKKLETAQKDNEAKELKITELSAKTSIYEFFSTNEATLNNYGYPGCAELDVAECFENIKEKHEEIKTQKEQLQRNERALNNLQGRFKTKEDDFLALTKQFNTRGRTKKLLQDELEQTDKKVKAQEKQLESNKTELTKLRTDRDKMESALKIAQEKLDKIKPQTLRTFIEANKNLIENDFPGRLASCVLNDEDVVSGDCMNEFQNLLNELLEFKKTGLTKLLNKHKKLKKKLEKNLKVQLSGNFKKNLKLLEQEIKDLTDLTQPEAKSTYDTIMEYVPLTAFLSIIVLILVSCAGAFAAFGGGGSTSALSFPETSQSQTNLEPGFYGSPFSLPKTSRRQINYFEDLSQFKITPQTRTDLEPGVHKPPLQVPSNLTYDTPFYQKNLKEVQKAVYPVSIYVQQKFGLRMEQATRSIIKQATDYDILRLHESFLKNHPTFKFNLKDLKAARDIFRNESLTYPVKDSGEGGTINNSNKPAQSAIEPVKTQPFPNKLDDLNKLLESESENLNDLRFDYDTDQAIQYFASYGAPVHILTALLDKRVKFLRGQRENMIEKVLEAGASPKFMDPRNVAKNIIYQADKLQSNQRETLNRILTKLIAKGMPVYGQNFDTISQRHYDIPGLGRIEGAYDLFMMHEHPRLKGTSTGEILKKAYDKIPSSGDSLASRTKLEHEESIEYDIEGVIRDAKKNKEYKESQGGNNSEDDNDDEPQAKTYTEQVKEALGGLYERLRAFGTVRESDLDVPTPVPYATKQISGLMMPHTARSRILASRLMY